VGLPREDEGSCQAVAIVTFRVAVHVQSVIFSQGSVITLGCKLPMRMVHLIEAWCESDTVPLGDEWGNWAY
jgi:hypothetical protein